MDTDDIFLAPVTDPDRGNIRHLVKRGLELFQFGVRLSKPYEKDEEHTIPMPDFHAARLAAWITERLPPRLLHVVSSALNRARHNGDELADASSARRHIIGVMPSMLDLSDVEQDRWESRLPPTEEHASISVCVWIDDKRITDVRFKTDRDLQWRMPLDTAMRDRILSAFGVDMVRRERERRRQEDAAPNARYVE